MLTTTLTEMAHIVRDENGVPVIEGTGVKVIEVALDLIAHGWSAEEMHRQHPHLSLAQLHAALAYYYDHREELDADIERRRRAVEKLEIVARSMQPSRAEWDERLHPRTRASK